MERLNNWIAGADSTPLSGDYDSGTNPATGDPTLLIASSDDADVDAAVTAAKEAAADWKNFPSASRGRILNRIAQAIRVNADEIVDLEIQDTGKPRHTAEWEVENSAAYFEFYATLVNLPAGDVLDVEPNHHMFTKREPFGVIGIITPWNLPLNQAARAVAPALTAGNTVVLKPPSTSSQTSVLLGKIAQEAGLPDGVLNVVLGRGTQVGTAIVSHPDVRKVAFTGSVATGRSIGRIAAERIIPLTLELGGKSANIVFEDADLEFAAKEAVRAFANNAGQVCSAGTRLLVQDSIHDEFVEKVAEIAGSLQEGTDVGPMITRQQFEEVQNYFEVAKAEGAQPLIGGTATQKPDLQGGFYIRPTIYPRVTNEMRIAREEIFGPVLVTIPFSTEEEAVRIANDSDFGLVGGVFTADIGRALRVSGDLEAGQIFINSWSTGAVQMPFGGHKHSGYGREKGIEALMHYTHLKSIVVVY